MSFLIFLFAIIGATAIILLFYYILRNTLNKKRDSDKSSRVRPSTLYMNEIGSRCPDYWINTKNINSQNYCANSYHLNVPTEEDPDYQHNKCNKLLSDMGGCTGGGQVSFKNIEDWDNIKDKKAIKDRCHFAKCCNQTWLGLDAKCRQYGAN